jgi:hypothetical protein
MNGPGLNRPCPKPNGAADRSPTRSGKSSTASGLSCGAGVPGGCYPMTSRRGRWSLPTFGAGAKTGPGYAGMRCGGARCGWPWANSATLAPGSSTATRARPPPQGEPRVGHVPTDQRPQTPPLRRYPRVTPARGGDGRPWARPRRGEAAGGGPPAAVFPVAAHRGRGGRGGRPRRVGVGPTAPAKSLLGDGQAAPRRQGVPATPLAWDRGADLRRVGPLPPLISR